MVPSLLREQPRHGPSGMLMEDRSAPPALPAAAPTCRLAIPPLGHMPPERADWEGWASRGKQKDNPVSEEMNP